MNNRNYGSAERTGQIHSLVSQMQGLADQAVLEVVSEIDSIIKSEEHDRKRIEYLLDHMLGFCFYDKMLFEFKRLCRYFYTINPQTTIDYVHACREMWEQDDAHDIELSMDNIL